MTVCHEQCFIDNNYVIVQLEIPCPQLVGSAYSETADFHAGFDTFKTVCIFASQETQVRQILHTRSKKIENSQPLSVARQRDYFGK